jgi:hypothetical protein
MKKLWHQLEDLLRNREWHRNEESLRRIPLGPLLLTAILLAAIYGFFMGWYAVFSRPDPEYRQVLSCLWKVPMLFLATLFICFPSLYVFSTLLGSRLSFLAVLTLLLGITTISVTVLASFGPIVAFFALSTQNYHFMKLLNVLFFAVAGFFGVSSLLKALQSLLTSLPEGPPPLPPVAAPPFVRAFEENEATRKVNTVFRIWILIYMIVGAQMGWVLRPFLCDPNSSFAWFRKRHANFFVDVWHAVLKLFS